MKLRFQGKIYKVIEFIQPSDASIIKEQAKVVNSKGVEFTFIHPISGYYLYDNKGNRVAETLSIKWSDSNDRFNTI